MADGRWVKTAQYSTVSIYLVLRGTWYIFISYLVPGACLQAGSSIKLQIPSDANVHAVFESETLT